MPPRLRRAALTAHVVASVGWLGAVAVFLVLAIVGMTHHDPALVRGVYLVMEPAAWYALVPLAIATSVTGLVMSIGTTWGLLRHYWVIFKLAIAGLATAILLVYLQTFDQLARVAADPGTDLHAVRNPSPVLHAALALVGLMVATILAIHKPRGMTRFGRRRAARGR